MHDQLCDQCMISHVTITWYLRDHCMISHVSSAAILLETTLSRLILLSFENTKFEMDLRIYLWMIKCISLLMDDWDAYVKRIFCT